MEQPGSNAMPFGEFGIGLDTRGRKEETETWSLGKPKLLHFSHISLHTKFDMRNRSSNLRCVHLQLL